MSKTLKKMVKNSDRVFFYGLHLLSKRKRRAMYALYSFKKHVSDIALSNDEQTKKNELFDAWEEELCDIYDKGCPKSRIGKEIFDVCRPFGLSKDDFIAEIDFLRNDLIAKKTPLTESEFRSCCDCFSGTMVRQILRVLGCRDENLIKDLSASLGLAIGITMILRNMKDDANRGHFYMPILCLHKADISNYSPQDIIMDNRLGVARCELAKIGRDNFTYSLNLINKLNIKTARRMKAFVYVYKHYFEVMEKRGWEVISPKPVLKPWDSVKLLFKAYMEK